MLVTEARDSMDRWPIISYRLQDVEDDESEVIDARDSFPTSMELVRDVAKSEYLEDATLVMDAREALEIRVIEDSLIGSCSIKSSGSKESSGSSETGSGDGVGAAGDCSL